MEPIIIGILVGIILVAAAEALIILFVMGAERHRAEQATRSTERQGH